MWALRRAANPLRSQSQHIVVARTCCAKTDAFGGKTQQRSHYDTENQMAGGCTLPKLYCHEPTISARSVFWSRNLSSQAGAKSSDGEDELEGGFSDLETPPEGGKTPDVVDEEDEGAGSGGDTLEEEAVETAEGALGSLDAETDGEKTVGFRAIVFPLLKILLETPRASINGALDTWVSEGKPLGRDEIAYVLHNLRRRRFYGKGLQLFEWLDANKRLDFTDRDHASHLDLIAKVFGIAKAEKYLDNIPESLKSELHYRTVLANCVASGNVRKSEEVFNRIKDLGFPITAFACNQLLLLYKRIDRKKIPDVLELMEKENVKPSLFTYRLLIDVKGRANDISGMEQIVQMMEAEGVEPDIMVYAQLAKFYIFGNLIEKAEAMLKKIEGDDINENRSACKEVLPLYAALGKAYDVERIWKVCEDSPRLEECVAVIEAWGKLGKIENAEKVFEHMLKTWNRISPRYYNAMLKVYANHKLLSKGKDLAKQMSEKGYRIGPTTWDVLVKLYCETGEVEKADSMLQKAVQQNQFKPLYTSYLAILEKYANRGDIHQAEKIFLKLRQNGYLGRIKPYQILLQAYIHAKAPAYGFRERMKGDDMIPNRGLEAQLMAIDGFKRSQISDLLD